MLGTVFYGPSMPDLLILIIIVQKQFVSDIQIAYIDTYFYRVVRQIYLLSRP